MTCACGSHHRHVQPITPAGEEIILDAPMLSLSGQLRCSDLGQLLKALELLPEHAELSRAEPGNLRFDLAQTDNPLIFALNELYADDEAFQAHRTRLRGARWGAESKGIGRALELHEIMPRLRAEMYHDQDAISELLLRVFGGPEEARLVDMLRRDGHLALSLVAEAAGTVIGHVALSPIVADIPALALAPVAVHPAMQGRGIGSALIRAAQEAFADHAIIVLGDPDYYGRFGFAPVDLASPYAGPHLMGTGCDGLPPGSRIAHAPAFSMI
ncbi:GNAT family N-acetyltransferase [Paracoccus lutimaris]|uniref:Putative acetyltransferase n=1 Tax=Paracoccus lutimaris TaxID=1490030 RepID=A0A368Z8C5_9RHOB|nr:GNAT family N-acetyltransferase [Paracoccus lutimaris]RCW88705.1 putative acetyltransferase [Paracoccus lutimaris]